MKACFMQFIRICFQIHISFIWNQMVMDARRHIFQMGMHDVRAEFFYGF